MADFARSDVPFVVSLRIWRKTVSKDEIRNASDDDGKSYYAQFFAHVSATSTKSVTEWGSREGERGGNGTILKHKLPRTVKE